MTMEPSPPGTAGTSSDGQQHTLAWIGCGLLACSMLAGLGAVLLFYQPLKARLAGLPTDTAASATAAPSTITDAPTTAAGQPTATTPPAAPAAYLESERIQLQFQPGSMILHVLPLQWRNPSETPDGSRRAMLLDLTRKEQPLLYIDRNNDGNPRNDQPRPGTRDTLVPQRPGANPAAQPGLVRFINTNWRQQEFSPGRHCAVNLQQNSVNNAFYSASVRPEYTLQAAVRFGTMTCSVVVNDYDISGSVSAADYWCIVPTAEAREALRRAMPTVVGRSGYEIGGTTFWLTQLGNDNTAWLTATEPLRPGESPTPTPAVPQLLKPAEGEIIGRSEYWLQLTWAAVPGAAKYQVEAEVHSAERGYQPWQRGTGQATQKLVNYQPNGSFRWRVRAITENGKCGAWSAWRKFTTGD